MPLGHGYTIEEQLTGETREGGIQIDVYPLLESSVRFSCETCHRLDISKSPKQLFIDKEVKLR